MDEARGLFGDPLDAAPRPLGDPMDEVAEALRASRRRHRLSQRELAALLGVDRALVGRWESGHGPAALARVSAVLGALGFALTVRALRPEEWVGRSDPTPTLADRGVRRFPAHLRAVTGRDATADWVRYRWAPDNPYAPGWTYRMDPGRRAELRDRVASAAIWPTTVASEDPVPAPTDDGVDTRDGNADD